MKIIIFTLLKIIKKILVLINSNNIKIKSNFRIFDIFSKYIEIIINYLFIRSNANKEKKKMKELKFHIYASIVKNINEEKNFQV